MQTNPSTTSEELSSLRTNSQYKHTYRNYKPYDPEEIKQQWVTQGEYTTQTGDVADETKRQLEQLHPMWADKDSQEPATMFDQQTYNVRSTTTTTRDTPQNPSSL